MSYFGAWSSLAIGSLIYGVSIGNDAKEIYTHMYWGGVGLLIHALFWRGEK